MRFDDRVRGRTGLSRRSVLAAAAATALVPAAPRAQVASVTSRLPKKYAGTTLKVLFGTGTSWDILAANSKEFSDATGIKLDFTMAQYMDRYTKMVLDATTGTASFDTYPIAYQWKHDAAPYVADLGNIDKEIEGCPPLDLADYPERPLAIYSKVDNKLVSLPVLGDVTFIIWNREHYRSIGADPEAGPKSWQDILANAAKLTGGNRYGFGMPAGKNTQTASFWMQLFNTSGGKYFVDGQPKFDSAASVGAFARMANEIQPFRPSGNLTWDISEIVNAFATGQTSQCLMWPAGFGILSDPAKSSVAGKFGWVTPPGGGLLGGHGVGVNAKSRNVEPAKLFVAWLASKEIVQRTAMAGASPVRTSAFTNPDLVARYPYMPEVLRALQGEVHEFVPTREAEQIHRMIFDEGNAAVAKTKTPERAAADLQRQVADFVRRRNLFR